MDGRRSRSAYDKRDCSITVPFLLEPPPISLSGEAIFLDLDGTLAPIACLPDAVAPEADRTSILLGLVGALGGRAAVLTGRTLEDADRILEGAIPNVAAVHGLVRRHAQGGAASPASPALDYAREALAILGAEHPGVFVEDKAVSLAVHYRAAPAAEASVRAETARLASLLGLVVQDGAMVSELRSPGPNKGDALRTFMDEPPFIGARPIMVGDDLTDEAAFAAAAAMGGYGVLVGPARDTQAVYRLNSVADVLDWLRGALK